MTHGREIFGRPIGRVAAGTVADPAQRSQIDVDVAVLGPAVPGERRSVISLGEVKWGDTMSLRHLVRLRRACDLLAASDYDTSETVLACSARAGFDAELRVARESDVPLADPDLIYG